MEDSPLAVCDARTIRPQDLVATDLRYRDRMGESIPSFVRTFHRVVDRSPRAYRRSDRA